MQRHLWQEISACLELKQIETFETDQVRARKMKAMLTNYEPIIKSLFTFYTYNIC